MDNKDDYGMNEYERAWINIGVSASDITCAQGGEILKNLNILRPLVEQSIAKEPTKKLRRMYYTDCPICGREIVYDSFNYCPGCGQKIDWKGV